MRLRRRQWFSEIRPQVSVENKEVWAPQKETWYDVFRLWGRSDSLRLEEFRGGRTKEVRKTTPRQISYSYAGDVDDVVVLVVWNILMIREGKGRRKGASRAGR